MARGSERKRAAGAGRKPKLVLHDRLLLTLVHLRHQLPHEVLAELFDIDPRLGGDPAGPPAARGARLRGARPAWGTTADAVRRLRLRREPLD
ncbi:transposase family protein [Streptomyces afghaniensis]|uniref:transposase family protein n=1 Tax=Streptomyces afghaniensis TaxID=66865 RepID=UPI00378D3E3E